MTETKCTEHLLFLTYNLICTVLKETKFTVYTLLENLHLDFLNQKVHMTYNNKDIDAYFYTISGLIIYLRINYHFISFMNKTKPLCFLFVSSFCTFCTIYSQNRSLNIHFAPNSQKCRNQIALERYSEFFRD